MSSLLSENIQIFPISFNRAGQYVRNSTPASDTLEDEQKKFLSTHGFISSDQYDESKDWLSSYYNLASETFYNGRALSEYNIARLIDALSDPDKSCYVTDATFNGAHTECSSITFVIHGRIFKVDFEDSDANLGKDDLWVSIKFDESYNLDAYDYLETSGGAEAYKLNGVSFSSDEPSESYSAKLKLLEKLSDNKLQVPIESRYRFKGNQIAMINGGTV